MGEVITIRAYGGWFINALPADNVTGKNCTHEGVSYTYGRLHDQRVKAIFNVKEGV